MKEHEIKKLYFTGNEARKILDCSVGWLKHYRNELGIRKGRKGSGWHKFSVHEINQLMEIRIKNAKK